MVQQGSDNRFGEAEPTAAIQYFERALERARKLIETSDLDNALTVLHELEERFFAGSRLFDLLGEVLLRQGRTEEGIRYRALYHQLKATLDAARECRHAFKPDAGMSPAQEMARAEEDSMKFRAEAHGELSHPSPTDTSFTPVTSAMGQELMRQGHFERAVAIFSVLVERNPGDKRLKEALDDARGKSRDQRALTTLSRWLANVESIKAERSIDA